MPRTKPQRRWLIPPVSAFLALLLLAALLLYGPFDGFRRLWIQSAMYSSRYQFLATMLYPASYIDKVIAAPFPAGQTTPGLPDARFTDAVQFAEIKGNYFRGYIVKLEDPRRLTLVTAAAAGGEDTPGGQLLEDFCAAGGVTALGGVNGGGYRDHTNRGLPWGMLVADGVQVNVCTEHGEHSIGGLTHDNKLIVGRMTSGELAEHAFRWAFEFGPILILNGEKTTLAPYSGGLAPRTAIGQTREGHILLVVVDGRQASSIGATHEDIQRILYANGAINAIELDGGSSSGMVYGGCLVSKPSEGKEARLLPNALIFR